MNVLLWPLWLRIAALAVAAIVVGVGVALTLSGLFGDRARGRPRCPRCWFDMSGTPGMTCGECGRTARSARDLLRTRKRPVRTIAGLLMAVSVGALAGDELSRSGWAGFLPTSALVTLLPVVGDQQMSLAREMSARLRAGDVEPEQALVLLKRVMRGSWFASPPEEAWLRQYGPMADLLSSAVRQSGRAPLRTEADALIFQTVSLAPPEVRVRSGASVAAGRPIPVIAEISEWWIERGDVRLEITARIDGAPPYRVMRHQRLQPTHGFTITLPPMEPGTHEITFDIHCDRRATRDAPWQAMAVRQTSARFVVTDHESTPELRRDEELDEAIRTVFSGGLAHYEGGVLPVRISIDRRPTFREAFEGVAFGIEVDVLRGEMVVRRLTSWWLGGEISSPRQVLWEVPWFDDEALAPPPEEDEIWTLRVRSRPDLAAQVEGATSIWDGEVTIPAPIRQIGRRAPATVWLPWDAGAEDDGSDGD